MHRNNSTPAVEEVSIETIADDILAHYDHVAGIEVILTDNENPRWASIYVSTADVPDFEDPAPLYRSDRYRLVIDNNSDVLCSMPFTIIAEPYGPQFETVDTTPIFLNGGITLEDGLERLRRKIGKPRDELPDGIWGQQVESN